MAWRRRKPLGVQMKCVPPCPLPTHTQQLHRCVSLDPTGTFVPDNVDRLAFKYMEMCKVESSTDSEREISLRWSDTSTVGCGSSAAESDGVPRTLPLRPMSTGRHGCCSVFLDPYDGSSEDSDVSMDVQWNRRIRQAAKSTVCWCVTRNRRFNQQPHHQPAPEPIKTSMEKEKNTVSYYENSNFHTAMSYSDKGDSQAFDIEQSELDAGGPCLMSGWSFMMDRSPSPSNLHKRKFGVPGAELVDQAQRKRQCVVDMELEEDTTLTY